MFLYNTGYSAMLRVHTKVLFQHHWSG